MNFNKGKYGDFLISTTDSLENYQILQYFDMVSARVVVGAGFVTEFFASFTDSFGGRSQSVENRLSELYTTALNELVDKAKLVGANAIVGIKLDIDQISGKGSFMFMISAIGTPVFAERNKAYPLMDEFIKQKTEEKKNAEKKAQEEAAEKERRAAEEAKRRADAYWKNRGEEKELLEKEKATIEKEMAFLLNGISNHPGHKERSKILDQISALRDDVASLGWRNTKEKQVLESQIEALRSKANQLYDQTELEKEDLRKKRAILGERLKYIMDQLDTGFITDSNT